MKFITSVFIISLSLFLFSCEDDIIVKIPDHGGRLVVESWLGTDSQQNGYSNFVKLTRSGNFTTDSLRSVMDAKVSIISSTNRVYETEYLSYGRYYLVEADTTGETSQESTTFYVDSTYFLEIELSDGKLYRSTPQTVLPVTEIDSMYFVGAEVAKEKKPELFFSDFDEIVAVIKFFDDRDREDYMRWRNITRSDDKDKGLGVKTYSDDITTQDFFTEIGYQWFVGNYKIGDTVTIYQMSITKEVYNYIDQVQSQSLNGSPFATPPAPVLGNVYNVNDSNELVHGIFSISGISHVTLKITEENVYNGDN